MYLIPFKRLRAEISSSERVGRLPERLEPVLLLSVDIVIAC